MAKKYDNKVPRKQKKAVKKKAGLQGQKVQKEQVVNLANKETQKQRRANQAARRYNENIELLKSVGLPTNIITKKTSQKETRRIVDEYLSTQQKTEKRRQIEQRYAYKINRLIDAGFTPEEAQKIAGSVSRQLSNAKIDEVIAKKNAPPTNSSIRLKGKQYLYVGVCEIKDGFSIPNTKGLTVNQLKDYIQEILTAAKASPDGSGSFSSAFSVAFGSRSNMQHRAKVMYNRGYNMDPQHLKLQENQYQKITVSNAWNEHEFLSMFYACASQMKNSDVIDFNNKLKNYCNENGFPFMDDFEYIRRK